MLIMMMHAIRSFKVIISFDPGLVNGGCTPKLIKTASSQIDNSLVSKCVAVESLPMRIGW